MTERTITQKNYNPSRYEMHKNYGGYISASDFCTSGNNGGAVDKVVAAMRFDEKCKRNIKLYRD